jgi:hypothetical protein
MFYAADNVYSTPTSVGFANTWQVLAFQDRATRDAWVRNDEGLAARAIKRNEIRKYLHEVPKPLTGQMYALVAPTIDEGNPDGLIGYIQVADRGEFGFIEPLNK